MMTKICHRINLLPIIAKRDGLTDIELIQCKHAINRDILENKIQIFNFLSKLNDDAGADAGADANADHHYKRDGDIEEYMTLSAKEYNYLSELNKSIPFAIIDRIQLLVTHKMRLLEILNGEVSKLKIRIFVILKY